MSVERVYVEESIAEPFIQAVLSKTKRLRQGIDSGYDMDVGSMTRLAQIDLIEDHLEDATARGAKVLTGGKRSAALGDAFFEPTVLVGVDHDMRVMREESFGQTTPLASHACRDRPRRVPSARRMHRPAQPSACHP